MQWYFGNVFEKCSISTELSFMVTSQSYVFFDFTSVFNKNQNVKYINYKKIALHSSWYTEGGVTV